MHPPGVFLFAPPVTPTGNIEKIRGKAREIGNAARGDRARKGAAPRNVKLPFASSESDGGDAQGRTAPTVLPRSFSPFLPPPHSSHLLLPRTNRRPRNPPPSTKPRRQKIRGGHKAREPRILGSRASRNSEGAMKAEKGSCIRWDARARRAQGVRARATVVVVVMEEEEGKAVGSKPAFVHTRWNEGDKGWGGDDRETVR